MKYSLLSATAALLGTTAAAGGLGHKSEMSRLHKSFKHKMNEVKSSELMELYKDSYYASAEYKSLNASVKSEYLWGEI